MGQLIASDIEQPQLIGINFLTKFSEFLLER